MRRISKTVLLAVLFVLLSMVVGGLVPPHWVHMAGRDYYVQQ